MGKLVLVTGGARSGKSSFGEKYAAKYGKGWLILLPRRFGIRKWSFA